MKTFDAVVAGAGIVGAGAAFALARAGCRVALLDPGGAEAGGDADAGTGTGTGMTSGASFAWINATAKTEREDYHRLNAAGAEHYRALAREFGEERIGLFPTGMIAWANPDDEARRAELRAQQARLREWGYPAAPVDEAGLRALEPHVAFRPGAEGFLAYGDAWLEAPRAIAFFREEVRARGGAVRTGVRVTGLVRDADGAVRGVETGGAADGTIAAPAVVLAAGADTERCLRAWLRPEELGNRPFLAREPGLLVDTPARGPFRLVRHVLYSGDNALHLRPTPEGGLRIGSVDADPEREREAPEDLAARVRALLARAAALVPALGDGDGDGDGDGSTAGAADAAGRLEALAAACTVRVGVRPVPADDRAAAGPVPAAPGLYVIVTHSGVTLGPYLGSLAARELAEGRMPPELAPFRFERFCRP